MPRDLRDLRERLGKCCGTCATCANVSANAAGLARPAQMPRRNQTNARRLMCPRSASGFIHEGPAAFHGCRLFLYAHFEQPAIFVPPRDGVSIVILASSRHGTASQPSFWPRPAAGRRLNRHFGFVPPREGVSTVILASSRHGTASQPSFWPRPAAGQRLNRHFGLVPPRDGVSMVILASSRRGMASSRSSAPSSSGSASNRCATSATNSKKRPIGATSREPT